MIMKADAYNVERPSIKRPKLIFLIAIWVFYQNVFYVSVPLRLLENQINAPHGIVSFVGAILSWGVIILLLLFINLRNIPRLIVTALVSIAVLFNTHAIIYGITLKGYYIPPGMRSIAVISVFIIINILIVYYLTRKAFAKLSKDYRREFVALNKKRKTRSEPIIYKKSKDIKES